MSHTITATATDTSWEATIAAGLAATLAALHALEAGNAPTTSYATGPDGRRVYTVDIDDDAARSSSQTVTR